MNPSRKFFRVALLAVAFLVAGPAFAQATRTWVSGVGDDINPCSRTAPCKTFAGAIIKTADNGEISVIDPGSYGALTITKGLTIDGNGQIAAVLGSGSSGIIINAPSTSNVVLRNLSINGVSGALSGIRYIAGKSVTIDNVSIRGFDRAISFDGGASVTGSLRIVDSHLEANTTGIFLTPDPTSTVTALIARTQVVNNGAGLRAESGSKVSVAESTIAGNTNSGINGVGPLGAAVVLVSVDSSQVSGNGVGIKSTSPAATVRVSGSTVTNNATGLQSALGGALLSFGDNQVIDNGADGAFTGNIPMQ